MLKTSCPKLLAFLVLTQAALLACSGGEDSSSTDSADTSTAGGIVVTGGTSGTGDSGQTGTETASTDGSSTDASGSGGTTATSGSGTTSSAGAGGTVLDPIELCGGVCQCGNGIDDDGDGKIDGFDEECTGAADDDEGSFATGISGDNQDPKWQDCFFDGNSGAGDDGCRYHTDCLTGDLAPNDPNCSVTQACVDFCMERTPNGCDCFGCCTFETSDGPLSIQIGVTCDYEDIDDEALCPRCTPSTQCGNECGECELCPGKEELPETCDNDVPECDDGRQACDAETACPGGYWCQLGCCIIQAIE